ncbi:hypothetical protein WKW77_14785 [Variovorax ureilyticus]|uniref:SRPBCC family protein n=1 Tax=Variovorax ureilyticus TaxID=1836198 RepID=A0ABU8VFA9_9BURK
MTTSPEMHCASALCRVPAARALAFLADGVRLGDWALGCWQTRDVGNGVVQGHSLFDGQPGWVRPIADAARMTVTYHVGGSPEMLSPRIHATVEPGSAFGEGDDRCRISLHASRTPDMNDDRWLRLVRCHEVEVLLIQSQLARTATD